MGVSCRAAKGAGSAYAETEGLFVTTPSSRLCRATSPYTGEASSEVWSPCTGEASSEIWPPCAKGAGSAYAESGGLFVLQPFRHGCAEPPPLHKEGEALISGNYAEPPPTGLLRSPRTGEAKLYVLCPFTKKQGMLSHPLPCFYTYFRIVSDAFSSAREQVITQCTLDLDVSASISPKKRSNAGISSPQIFRAESI